MATTVVLSTVFIPFDFRSARQEFEYFFCHLFFCLLL